MVNDATFRSPALITVLALGLLGGVATAHHSPEEVIAAPTEKIEKEGEKPDLFYKRATEYRALRSYSEAAADFRKVASLQPKAMEPRRSLAQVLLWQKKYPEALASARLALRFSKSPVEQAFAHILIAQIEQESGNLENALAACEAAFKAHPRAEIDWFLMRSEILRALGRTEAQITGLATGHKSTGSIVLRNAWIDALIDGGYHHQALPIIEKELAACRLRSSWLLRRARALTGLQQHASARKDLIEAIDELDRRIHPLRPHPGLLLDRAFAHALLGETGAARAYLDLAKSLKADPWVAGQVETLIAKATDSPAGSL